MIQRILLATFFLSVCAFLVACGSADAVEPVSGGDSGAVDDSTPLLEEDVIDAGRLAQLQLDELGRVREQHASLIRSIPTPTPEPGPSGSSEVAQEAVSRVVAWSDGFPVPPPADEFWFDPADGLTFLRLDGGDWTSRSLRASHSHRHLFYRSDSPEGIVSFADGSLQRAIASRLAFGAAEFMPILGSPTPQVIELFSRRFGWEIRHADGPVVNVWTVYDFHDGDAVQTFAVGGVMVLQVKTTSRTGSVVHYLAPGHWLGSVVVERLR